jgi:hypothetical protein
VIGEYGSRTWKQARLLAREPSEAGAATFLCQLPRAFISFTESEGNEPTTSCMAATCAWS